MRRIPLLDVYDDDPENTPTTVAPDRTAAALMLIDPGTDERQSGVRTMLDSALASYEDGVDVEIEEDEVYDPQATAKYRRPKTDDTVTLQAEMPGERLESLVAIYASRPISEPPPPMPSKPPARKVTPAKLRMTLVECWSALDLRTRIGLFAGWMAMWSLLTWLLAR
jgi:hypothetical protein